MNEPADWQDAACRGKPLAWWFAMGGMTARARLVCSGCPRQRDCVAWSLRQGADLHGIWGGLTPAERERERAWRARHGEPVCAVCAVAPAHKEALRQHLAAHRAAGASLSYRRDRITLMRQEETLR